MPRGAKPGERRGGRTKGTPNKATAERQEDLDQALADAFAEFDQDFINNLSETEFQRLAWRAAVKAGHIRAAFAMSKEAAPYFVARPAPKHPDDEAANVIIIRGGFQKKPDGA